MCIAKAKNMIVPGVLRVNACKSRLLYIVTQLSDVAGTSLSAPIRALHIQTYRVLRRRHSRLLVVLVARLLSVRFAKGFRILGCSDVLMSTVICVPGGQIFNLGHALAVLIVSCIPSRLGDDENTILRVCVNCDARVIRCLDIQDPSMPQGETNND